MAIPFLPGVPVLLSYADDDFLSSLLFDDGLDIYSTSFPSQWGIFLDGSPIITADTIASFNYKQEWSISDYPVEEGAFATYDKVQIPFDARFRFVAGGSEDNRISLLESIDAAAADKTSLYDVVTPEKVYPSVTISHYDYSRTAVNGVGMIQVDVWCFNVVVLDSGNFSSTSSSGGDDNVASPSAADPTNDGSVNASNYPTSFFTQAGGTATPGPIGTIGTPSFPSGDSFANFSF